MSALSNSWHYQRRWRNNGTILCTSDGNTYLRRFNQIRAAQCFFVIVLKVQEREGVFSTWSVNTIVGAASGNYPPTYIYAQRRQDNIIPFSDCCKYTTAEGTQSLFLFSCRQSTRLDTRVYCPKTKSRLSRNCLCRLTDCHTDIV